MSNNASFTDPIDFKSLFQSAPGAYLVLNPGFTIIAVSDTYLKATKTKREEILGRYLFEIFTDDPNDPAATGARNLRISLERVLQTLSPDTMAVQKYSIRLPESEGGGFEERHWSPVNSPVFNDHGKLTYIIHRVEDVTEFVRLKQKDEKQSEVSEQLRTRAGQLEVDIVKRSHELQKAKEEAETANTIKSQFFANVSHELRTPLTLILGPLERLLSDMQFSSKQRADFEIMQRNSLLLLKHVNDLLDVSKLEAKRIKTQYSEFNLVQWIKRMVANFEALAAEKKITCLVETPETLIAQLDFDKLQRILMNLLSNAFKFTPEEGKIRCTLMQNNDKVTIQVADSGPGIPEKIREIVFERFFQAEESLTRRHGGTGLGLSICKDFVELQNGSISVNKAPEGGALFTVSLPLLAPANASVSSESIEYEKVLNMPQPILKSPAASLVQPHHTKKTKLGTILIVEDNVDMNQFIVETLVEDFEVITAANGQEGLEQAIKYKPDVIVTDVMMPIMSGAQLAEEIFKNPELSDIPIVFLSAKADDVLRLRMLEQGAYDYLMKPFSCEELKVRIRNFTVLKKTRDALHEKNKILNQTNKELETFSYSVSHDLRAPLRSIIGFGNILLEEHTEVLNAEGQDYLKRIVLAGQRMGYLIDGLLNLAQLARKEIKYVKLDLKDIAHQILEELRQNDLGRKITAIMPAPIIVNADPNLIYLVLQNLINNAWKFTGRTPEAMIELGVTQKNKKSVYFVRDNGVGFDMAYAGKLFGVFQRLHSNQDFAGHGIGLATTQRIIHRHGGDIWAESAVNQGSTFYFTLNEHNIGECNDKKS
ncbi:MAG: response regulator [Proteobacteria bacterium]|nr:response regulator [Pseudomonadota bacterium]